MPGRIGDTSLITTIVFVLIAIMAVLTVLGIGWGMRLKRQRREAEEVAAEQADADDTAPGAVDQPARAVPPPASPPPPTPTESLPVPAAERAPTPPAPASPATHSHPPAPPAARPVAKPSEPPAGDPIADEPIAAAAPMLADPAIEAIPAPASPPPAPPEVAVQPAQQPAPEPAPEPAVSLADAPVTQLKGLGPKVAGRLADLGITTIGELAALDAGQSEQIDARLGPFTGRMARDRWIEQARFLAAGDRKGFEAVFGRL